MKKLLLILAIFASQILLAQNVGIGTTAPLQKLHVEGTTFLNGNVGVGTSTPEFKLSLDNDGAIIAKGTYNSGAPLTTSGPGTRMLWYPKKAAFRAGYVSVTQWDDANIGNFSFASGYDAKASGYYSTAMGLNTIASGSVSTAIGQSTMASEISSTAMGGYTTASGLYSTAMGANTTASGNRATSMGANTMASGDRSTSMGSFTKAKGFASTVIGMYNDSLLANPEIIPTTTTPLFIVGNGDADNTRSNAMVVQKNGNVGIGTSTPNAKLSISADGTELVGTVAGNTLRTNAGNLGSTAGSEISLANIGFLSSNNSSLGIRGYRSFAGTDWISTALLIGYDVDNTVRAGGGFLALSANGNIGISTTTPQAKLDVNGSIKVNSLTIATGGAVSDFLIKNDAAGLVSFRKGYVGLGLNYIIALQGTYPNSNPPFVDGTYIGEIKLFSGYNPPFGWTLCNGQLLTINSNPLLFALIGTTYGGDGVNNFRLPDMRDAVPVHPGSNWLLGERSN